MTPQDRELAEAEADLARAVADLERASRRADFVLKWIFAPMVVLYVVLQVVVLILRLAE